MCGSILLAAPLQVECTYVGRRGDGDTSEDAIVIIQTICDDGLESAWRGDGEI